MKSLELARRGNSDSNDGMCYDGKKGRVIFYENTTTTTDEYVYNENLEVDAAVWRALLARLDSGETPVTAAGVTLTRQADRQIRVDWTKQLTNDPRCFPPGRPGHLVVQRADLVID